jgi:DNA-binding protein H-NS
MNTAAASAAETPAAKAPSSGPIAGVNPAKLKDEELRTLHDALGAEITARQTKAQTEFLAEMKEKAHRIGVDPATIAAAFGSAPSPSRTRSRSSGDKRAAVAPKYRNPANPSQTWAGRGIKPKWIELGPDKKPLAKFLIPSAS